MKGFNKKFCNRRRVAAFMGDGLILFFARESLCNTENEILAKINQGVCVMVSNEFLSKVAIAEGMKDGGGNRGFATLYEEKVYKIYKKKGFKKAFKYFKKTALKKYLER